MKTGGEKGVKALRCKKCGQYVYREKAPSCMEWCPSARQCLGEDRWKQLMGQDNKYEVG